MSFVDFCESLQPAARQELNRTITFKCKVSYNGVYFWMKGSYTPKGYATQEKITSIVNEMFGKNFTPEDLFPSLKN